MTINLDHEELHRLIVTLSGSDIQEFFLEGEDFRLEIKRNSSITTQAEVVTNQPTTFITAEQIAPQGIEKEQNNTQPSQDPPSAPGTRSDLIEITAPMVGTFYRAPSPDDSPFVDVGGRISVGQTVCIIEAMKLMNELESEISGEVVEILVENGTPVEFGQALMRVKA